MHMHNFHMVCLFFQFYNVSFSLDKCVGCVFLLLKFSFFHPPIPTSLDYISITLLLMTSSISQMTKTVRRQFVKYAKIYSHTHRAMQAYKYTCIYMYMLECKFNPSFALAFAILFSQHI